ncbi:MAG TPA: carboxypeptidase regulatory-like domain-containing protein [Bryobacteraceae bacterium]
MGSRLCTLLPWLLLALTIGDVRLQAQVDRTAITGMVVDSQGNRIPQCAVRVTEDATGFQRETFTTSQGSYELPGLPPGSYSVRFAKSGFAIFTAENVKQVVGQKRTLNARLDVAHGRQQTTISEPLVQLDKVDATIGAAIERKQIEEWILLNQGTSQSGTLTYTSTTNFLTNSMGSASYTALLPLVRQRKTQYFGYAQDEWKLTPNLTMTAGIRYNFFNALRALNNDAVPFDFATCGGYCARTDAFFHPRYDDFDPRMGIAWSRGDTVVRAGGGIYHTDGQEDDQNLPISNTVDRYSFSNTSFPALSFPLTPFLQFAESGGLGVVSPRDLDRNRKDNYVAAWTASVQQKLPGNVIGTGIYLGNKGTDVLTTTYVNLVDPRTGVAPYPAFGPVSWRGDVGNTTFHALQLNARRAFQKGFLFSASYMWSHSINDGSIGGGESDTPQNSFCRSCDRASSDDDVRQVFNLSGVYQLPFGAGRDLLRNSGVARALFGGWTLSGIGTWQTGLPMNITVDRSNRVVPGNFEISGSERPDSVAGVSAVPAGGSTPPAWVNPAAFRTPAAGTFGNLGRNAFRAPSISQVDLAFMKDVALRAERWRVRFRADVFNIFNRAQFGAPNGDISQVNFGVITTTISNYATGRGTPREFQLSGKVWF